MCFTYFKLHFALLSGCYKMKVWTDFRVRVRTEIRYSSSILLVYDKRREGM